MKILFKFIKTQRKRRTKNVPTTPEVKNDKSKQKLTNGDFAKKSYEKKILSKISADNKAFFEVFVPSSYPHKYGNNTPYIPNKNTQTNTKTRLKLFISILKK